MMERGQRHAENTSKSLVMQQANEYSFGNKFPSALGAFGSAGIMSLPQSLQGKAANYKKENMQKIITKRKREI